MIMTTHACRKVTVISTVSSDVNVTIHQELIGSQAERQILQQVCVNACGLTL